MSLTQEQIEKLGTNLSKLFIQDKENLVGNINSIVGYINILEEVDTKGVKPTVSVIYNENILREDILKEDIQKSEIKLAEELLNCSNQKIIGDQIALNDIMK